MEFIKFIANNAMTFLTAITVILLFYYTKETYFLRKESQKQTQFQFTPYLSLRNLENGATFSNLGKGVALNIKVDESVQFNGQPFLIIPSIGSKENRLLYYMLKDKCALSLDSIDLPNKINITYSDIMGNKYEASFLREYEGMGVFKEVSQKLISQIMLEARSFNIIKVIKIMLLGNKLKDQPTRASLETPTSLINN